MAGTVGLEPTTSRLTAERYYLFSFVPVLDAPTRTRTWNHLINSQALCQLSYGSKVDRQPLAREEAP